MADPAHDVQLSFDVAPHPSLRHVDNALLGASVKLTVDVPIIKDLQPGAKIVVALSGADGEVLATSEAEVQTVGFALIKHDGAVIGQERQHKAKLVD